jgi:hypothetical protein
VLYDDYRRRQYPDVDAIISAMTTRDNVDYVCCWRIAYSSDRVCAGFGSNDVLIATRVEPLNP